MTHLDEIWQAAEDAADAVGPEADISANKNRTKVVLRILNSGTLIVITSQV